MTDKQRRIRIWAMGLIDAYDRWQDAEYKEELDEAKSEYKRCLNNLSYNTGMDKESLERALGNQDHVTYNLDWLRALGVEI